MQICRYAKGASGGMFLKRTLSLFFLLQTAMFVIREGDCHVLGKHEEVFSEDLFLRPLSDGKILSHFYFKNSLRTLGSASHHHVFPKAISQLVQKFHIREMELSFTQGRWNYQRWGSLDPIPSFNAKPLGVELWAAFDVPVEQVDSTWRNLTHALSGLFCASINFLESPAMVATPEFTFGRGFSTIGSNREHQLRTSTARIKGDSRWLRYGALPREAVCTENLTPWLKLLPCRDKAGISALLDRPSIYKGYYHSLRVHLRSGNLRNMGSGSGNQGTVLEQTLTLVLQPLQNRAKPTYRDFPNWSLTSLFGRHLEGSCPLARTSHVLVEIEGWLVEKVRALDTNKNKTGMAGKNSVGIGKDSGAVYAQVTKELNIADNAAFALIPHADSVLVEARDPASDARPSSILLDYWLQEYTQARPLNLGMLWKEQISWPSLQGPFRVSRFLAGSGNQKGSIVVELKANFQHNLQEKQERTVGDPLLPLQHGATVDTVGVTIFQIVPWYVRLYFHTLTAFLDGYQVALSKVATRMRVLPAEERLSPAVLEIQLQLPVNISIFSLYIEFEKGFLHIDEHPPDASRGFDLSSALISFPTSTTRRNYPTSQIRSTHNESSFLQTFRDAGPVHIYSESLLVPLAIPDFSMPYNVITFTSTVLALYFGSLLNTLRRRIGEEERRQVKTTDLQKGGKLRQLFSRYLEGKSEMQKRFGVALVLVLAVAANHFLG